MLWPRLLFLIAIGLAIGLAVVYFSPIRAGGDPDPKDVIANDVSNIFMLSYVDTDAIIALDSEKLPKHVSSRLKSPLMAGVRYQIAPEAVGKRFEDIKDGEPIVIAIGPTIERVYGNPRQVFRR